MYNFGIWFCLPLLSYRFPIDASDSPPFHVPVAWTVNVHFSADALARRGEGAFGACAMANVVDSRIRTAAPAPLVDIDRPPSAVDTLHG